MYHPLLENGDSPRTSSSTSPSEKELKPSEFRRVTRSQTRAAREEEMRRRMQSLVQLPEEHAMSTRYPIISRIVTRSQTRAAREEEMRRRMQSPVQLPEEHVMPTRYPIIRQRPNVRQDLLLSSADIIPGRPESTLVFSTEPRGNRPLKGNVIMNAVVTKYHLGSRIRQNPLNRRVTRSQTWAAREEKMRRRMQSPVQLPEEHAMPTGYPIRRKPIKLKSNTNSPPRKPKPVSTKGKLSKPTVTPEYEDVQQMNKQAPVARKQPRTRNKRVETENSVTENEMALIKLLRAKRIDVTKVKILSSRREHLLISDDYTDSEIEEIDLTAREVRSPAFQNNLPNFDQYGLPNWWPKADSYTLHAPWGA